jgi:hypothetical protein
MTSWDRQSSEMVREKGIIIPAGLTSSYNAGLTRMTDLNQGYYKVLLCGWGQLSSSESSF